MKVVSVVKFGHKLSLITCEKSSILARWSWIPPFRFLEEKTIEVQYIKKYLGDFYSYPEGKEVSAGQYFELKTLIDEYKIRQAIEEEFES